MSGLRILVVDDDRDFAETIGDVFEAREHQVALAFTGEEAVERATVFDFDLAFMDVRLPGMNGVESFLEIRNRRPHAKVILMTGFNVKDLTDRAIENGAWAVLTKPLSIPQIINIADQIKPGGNILLIDDDEDFSVVIQGILEQHGYQVTAASGGKTALEELETKDIDLVLLDIRLKDMNGSMVYSEIRKRKGDIPILIITGFPETEAEKISPMNSSPHTGVMIKPIDPSMLCTKIQEMIHPQYPKVRNSE
ncbi:MAG: response regulator [Candidatus Omnitrophica bacterium]|nr:response regulator [Candidatus Omnitrophota bacterium]